MHKDVWLLRAGNASFLGWLSGEFQESLGLLAIVSSACIMILGCLVVIFLWSAGGILELQ